MKTRFLLSSLLALSIIGCSTPMINTSQDFTDLEKEYKSFSTKALSDAYVKRMFGKYLSPVNTTQLTRQLEFSRYLKSHGDTSYETSLKSMFAQTPSLYNTMTGASAPDIQNKMSTESATFGTFVRSLSPFPGVPTANAASGITASSFTASWNTVSNATGYVLTVTNGGSSTDYTLGTVTSHNLTGLISNTSYSYSVKAINSSGESGSSNSVNISTLNGTPSAPAATGATNVTAVSFTASWSSVSTATGYILTVTQGGTSTDYNLGLVYTYNVTGLNSFTNYSYTVKATNVSGSGASSNVINFKTDASSYYVSTIAGQAASGSTDAQGALAKFSAPLGIITDNNGNIYVSEISNYKIRKIDSLYNVTTFAGSGTATFADGQGTLASFKSPRHMVRDNNGNIYIADMTNNMIRKIDPSGNVTTFAGQATAGSTNANGTFAQFNGPYGITGDNNGNLYVADFSGCRIRKIDPSGNVTTIAGSGVGGSENANGTFASFRNPAGIAIDSNGNLFVSDMSNYIVRKIDTLGNVTTFAGRGGQSDVDGQGTLAYFRGPGGITIDSNDNLYVADPYNNKIRKIDPSGYVTTVAGGGGTIGAFADGTGTIARFSSPYGVTIDSNGILYVADYGNQRIRKITPQ